MSALTFAAARVMAEWADQTVVCIVCGGEPTHVGLTLLPNNLLAAVAWCNRRQDCIDDAAATVKSGTAIVRPVTP